MTGADPKAIYERHLRQMSAACLHGDLVSVLSLFAVPSQIIMADREIVITTPQALDRALQDYAWCLQGEGVVAEHEVVLEATYITGGTDMIAGRHSTEWHFADGRAPHSFGNRMLLVRHAKGWQTIWLQSNLSGADLEVLSPEFVSAQAAVIQNIGKAHR